MSIQFRTAVPTDRDAVLALYRSVIGTPYCTWDEEYPGPEWVEMDTQAGGLWLLTDEHDLLGAISVVEENELDELDLWQFKDHAKEIARVAVAPSRRGQGLAKLMLDLLQAQLI